MLRPSDAISTKKYYLSTSTEVREKYLSTFYVRYVTDSN